MGNLAMQKFKYSVLIHGWNLPSWYTVLYIKSIPFSFLRLAAQLHGEKLWLAGVSARKSQLTEVPIYYTVRETAGT